MEVQSDHCDAAGAAFSYPPLCNSTKNNTDLSALRSYPGPPKYGSILLD